MITREQIINAADTAGFDIDWPNEYHGLSEVVDSGNRWITSRIEQLYQVAFASRDAEVAELRRQVKLLRDALRELVAVKRHKEISEIAEDASTRDYCGTQYQARKIPAWKAAEQALAATEPK